MSVTTQTIQPVTQERSCCEPTCCSDTTSQTATNQVASTEAIKQQVSERYGQFAKQRLTLEQLPVAIAASCCSPAPAANAGRCCGTGDALDENTVSRALNLYTPEEIRDLPPEVAEATLGCGNPQAIASLKEGEVVLDLGSGAGLDCFLAARQVGATGRVIGLDMTDNMLALARRNQQKVGLSNVEFRKGEIEKMPIESNSVDAIISNCVINLSPDKDAVFREAFRVLKPGGRFAVSDMVTRGEVPAAFRNAIELWAGCLSGALDELDYAQRLRAAGFAEVRVASSAPLPVETIEDWANNATEALGAEKAAELTSQTAQSLGGDCCGSNLPTQIANKIASAKIQARKPLVA
jgi:ubiquinone/menaquinone biosynthesis C-methylase UbiE